MKPNTRWVPLFSTSFFGVFNANYFKFLVITVAVNWLAKGSDNHSLIVSLASALFFVSYIFFSPLAGRMAKTMLKKKIIVYIRISQFPIYFLGCFGFFMENLYLVLFCLFLIGLTSTLYSPAKYGLIRDIGGNKGISFGTGTLEMLTFFGNIIGPLVASVVADNYNFWLLAGILVFVSIIGYVTAISIKAEESEPMKNVRETINPFKFLVQSFKWASTLKGMNLIVIGLGFFWMIDGMLQMNLVVHCPESLKLTNTEMSIVMAIALVGIGLGSYAAGIISRGKVELFLTPIGGAGMGLSLLAMYILRPTDIYYFSTLTFFAAMFSGIYMVPLSAYIQAKIEGRKQSDMIAYSNFVTFLLLFLASGLFGLIAKNLGTQFVFLFLLILIVTITIVLVVFVPDIKNRLKEKITKK